MGENKQDTVRIEDVPLVVRREIEALIAAPLIEAFAAEIGRERAFAIAGDAIRQLAKKAGAGMAEMVPENTVEAFVEQLLPIFKQNALEVTMTEQRPGMASWDTTRCRYAEMYRRLGLSDMGALLSCGRDSALFEGYNPSICFTRTQTLMEGGTCCDFCLTEKSK